MHLWHSPPVHKVGSSAHSDAVNGSPGLQAQTVHGQAPNTALPCGIAALLHHIGEGIAKSPAAV